MAFYHGVKTREVPTSLIAPVQINGGLPVIVGTAPVHLALDEDAFNNCNKAKLIYTYQEAVSQFGYSEDWDKYTLCEFIYSQFALFGMSPCVLINVFDPVKHSEKISGRKYQIEDSKINLGQDVLIANFEAASLDVDDDFGDGDEPESKEIYKLGQDYSLSYDDNGNLIFEVINTGTLMGKAEAYLTFTKLKPELVSANDIIGGIDAQTGDKKGLELVSEVFPKFRLVPGLIGSPKWSENPGVAAVMRAKCENINGIFSAMSVVDIPSNKDNADVYTKAAEWKNTNNYMSEFEIACWPKIKLDDKIFHTSTQLIGLMNSVDNSNGDIPFESPSNKNLQMNACVNSEGKEIYLGKDQADLLNSQGIVTPLNFYGGWRAWGNRTAAYPANTDPKDDFIPTRRMFNWIRNEFTLTFWQKADKPITRRLIHTIVDSFNLRLNGLQAIEAIIGGRIEFRSSENSLVNLMDGSLTFHIYFTPPSPAEQIEGIFEYDPEYLQTLFNTIV